MSDVVVLELILTLYECPNQDRMVLRRHKRNSIQSQLRGHDGKWQRAWYISAHNHVAESSQIPRLQHSYVLTTRVATNPAPQRSRAHQKHKTTPSTIMGLSQRHMSYDVPRRCPVRLVRAQQEGALIGSVSRDKSTNGMWRARDQMGKV